MLSETTKNVRMHARTHRIMGTSGLIGLGVGMVGEILELIILGLNLKGKVGCWENWKKGPLLNYNFAVISAIK